MGFAAKNLKNQLFELSATSHLAKAKGEEMSSRLSQFGEELEASKANAAKPKWEAAEGVKKALEAEMKKMGMQTKQWRKAARAASTVVVGDMEMNGRIFERCGSMDKHLGGMYQPPTEGYIGMVGSPGVCDVLDYGFGSGNHHS